MSDNLDLTLKIRGNAEGFVRATAESRAAAEKLRAEIGGAGPILVGQAQAAGAGIVQAARKSAEGVQAAVRQTITAEQEAVNERARIAARTASASTASTKQAATKAEKEAKRAADVADAEFVRAQRTAEKNFQYLQRLRLNSQKIEQDAAHVTQKIEQDAAHAAQKAVEALQRQRSTALLAHGKAEEREAAAAVRRAESTAKQIATINQSLFSKGLRLLPGGSDLANFQRIGADLARVQTQSAATASALAGVVPPTAAVGGGFLSLGALAGGAAIGIGAVAVGAIALTTAAFTAAKSAAEFGGHLYNLSQKTGLSVGTLSTLKVAADTSGASLETVSTSLVRYLKNVAEANHGNEKMSSAFKQVGIDAKEAFQSPDAAIQALIKRLAQVSSDEERLDLLTKIGIRNGGDLNGIVKEMDGNFAAFQRRAAEMGLVITPEQAKQADAFDDSLKLLELQIKGIGYTIGRDVMPIFQREVSKISTWLKDNKQEWHEWGENIGSVVQATLWSLNQLASVLHEINGFVHVVGAMAAGGVAGGVAGAITSGNAVIASQVAGEEAAYNAKRDAAYWESHALTRPRAGSGNMTGLGNDPREKPVTWREISELVKAQGFNVTSTTGGTHNVGSAHYAGRAVDVSVRGKSDEEVEEFIRAMEKRGLTVHDERTRPPGQKVWSGPHIHVEAKGTRAESELAREQKKAESEAESEAKRRATEAKQREAARLQAAREGTQARIRELRDEEQQIETNYRNTVDEAKYAYEEQTKSLKDFTNEQLAANDKAHTDKLSKLKDERAAVEASELKETEKAKLRTDIALRANAANFERDRNARAIRDVERKKEEAAEKAHQEALLRIDDEYDARVIASVKRSADERAITQEAAEKRILEIESLAFDRRRASLVKDIADANANVEARQKASDALTAFDVAHAGGVEQSTRRVIDARQKDIQAEAAFFGELQKLQEENRAAAFDLNQQKIDTAAASGGASRTSTVQAQLAQDIAAERQRSAIARDAIANMRIVNLEEKKTKEQRLAIDIQIDKKEETEEQKHQLALKKIQDDGQKALERLNPASKRSKFGDVYADTFQKTRSQIQSVAATAKDTFEQMSASAGNMSSMMGGAFGSVTGGLGQMAEAFLVTGELSGKALAKMLVQTMAHLSAESGVKALYEAAAGWASSAAYDYKAAAQHFTAASIFGTVAAVAGAGALAGSFAFGTRGGGQKSAGAALTGGGAGGATGSGAAGGSNAPVYQPFNYNGQGGTFSASQANAQGSRSLLGAIQENTQATRELHQKISSQPFDHLLMAHPLVVADAVMSASDASHRINTELPKNARLG